MGWVDKHGRPELVVHPDILAGTAVYRIAEDQDVPPADPAEPTPKQRARRRVLDQLAAEHHARRDFDTATGSAVEPARRRLEAEEATSARMTQAWTERLAAESATSSRRATSDRNATRTTPKRPG